MRAQVSQYGERSVLIELEQVKPVSVIDSFRLLFPDAEVRSGLNTLVITFPEISDHTELVLSALSKVETVESSTEHRTFVIATEYSGEDLETVCQKLEITRAKLISFHTAITWQVALIGFAPGFPYLVPFDENQEEAKLLAQIPRLEVPRAKVPTGSVAIASGMSCVYPSSMPGGWNLIGSTEQVLFDVNNHENPALLQAGDLVRFEELKS
ncbi:MAG: carboxyltransferase domain-containing protein [Micrococcales bacterium]|nr:carboxyltransferase domain-containing protein [Micrococcales bacterium]NBR61068.1 carboxyltransferase domain-containing protein [Actinomycetota bacterium]NBR54996.1 carboxyltransferase domain-containing protein [Micrococcales bacterium]NBT47808.1 carboxyltransferase domain-containing protein [Actinomycetota bacterium]NBY43638.1 carboxyltransferase domain-containing protein [Micrococcales bacterium]